MFDKGKVEKNEDKFLALQNNLATHLKASGLSYNNGDTFYKEFSGFISHLSSTYESLQNSYKQSVTTYARDHEELAAKAKKDDEFAKNSDAAIKAMIDDKVKKTKHLDEAKAKAKENLDGLNYKNLGKLKVKGDANLTRFFETFFRTFYTESKEEFNWEKFRDQAILKDKIEDFKGRLMNNELTKIPQEQITTLVNLKDDAWVKDYVTNKKEGGALLDLVNYLEYVNPMITAQRELTTLNYESERVKKDVPKRTESAKIEAAQAELLKQNIAYLDTINAKINKGAEPFGEEVKKTDEMIKAYDQHKQRLRALVHDEFGKVKQVPTSVYQGGDQ